MIPPGAGRRTLLHELKPSDPVGALVWCYPVVTPDGRGYAYDCAQFLHNLYLVDGLK